MSHGLSVGMMEWIKLKVSVPIPDHLRDFGADHERYEVMQIFPM